MNSDSQYVPPSEAIAYHPFLWNEEKIIAFQEISSRYSKEQNGMNYFDKRLNLLQQWLFLEKYKDDDEYDEVYDYYHSHYNFSNISICGDFVSRYMPLIRPHYLFVRR